MGGTVDDCVNDPKFQEILGKIRRFAETAPDLLALQEFCVAQIAWELAYYNWVGFYMLDQHDPGVLLLGPFRGASTEHVRIPASNGICGAAVSQEKTIIVDDVASDPRYLACSLDTQSEIVVPLRAGNRIVGEIDVDSHSPAAFDEKDRTFLEECATIIGRFIIAHCC